jgi:transcriptional regulator with XRE-family HTH domain
MQRKLQQEKHIQLIAKSICEARESRSLTLEKLANETGVDKSQLWRFCKGEFKRVSPNLQITLRYLQIEDVLDDPPWESAIPPDVRKRLEDVWERAGSRQAAVVAAIDAIERLLE